MYFNVKGYKILYTRKRFQEMNDEIVSSLTKSEINSIWAELAFKNVNTNHYELEKRQILKLKEEHEKLSEHEFFYKWVALSLDGEEAAKICFTLLCDYFEIHKNGQVKAISKLNGQPAIELDGKRHIFPQDTTAVLEFNVTNKRGLINNLFSSKETLIIVIDIAKIELIEGTFDDLKIYTDQQVIRLSSRIEVMSNFIKN